MKYVDQAPAISGISIRDGTFDMINPQKSQEFISKIPGSGLKFNPGIPLEPDVDMLYQNSWIEADQLLSDKEIYFVVFSENL